VCRHLGCETLVEVLLQRRRDNDSARFLLPVCQLCVRHQHRWIRAAIGMLLPVTVMERGRALDKVAVTDERCHRAASRCTSAHRITKRLVDRNADAPRAGAEDALR
jgi:hypothetical protein